MSTFATRSCHRAPVHRLQSTAVRRALAAVVLMVPLAFAIWATPALADPARALQAAAAAQRGDLATASRLYADELRELEQTLGEQHPSSLITTALLIRSYRGQGRFAEALPQAEKLLRIRTQLHGERHAETLSALAQLAQVMGGLGRLREELTLNEQFHRQSLEQLGERHPLTQQAMASLAASRRVMGRAGDGLPLAERVLALRREQLGERHPATLASMNELAQTLGALGRNDEQIALAESLHQIQRELHGERHHDTLLALGNLASAYQVAGRMAQALPIHERVLALRSEVLGPRNQGTLVAMNELARIYDQQGRHAEALALDERHLARLVEILGEAHPTTMVARGNLARQYGELGRHDQALALSEKNHQLYLERLGERSPATLAALNNLAAAYSASGRPAEGTALAERLVRLQAEVQGDKHRATLIARSVLAHAYRLQGRTAQAQEIYAQLLTLNTELNGLRHVDTLNAMHNLALAESELGHSVQALALLEQVVPLCTEVLGARHPRTLSSIAALASRLLEMKRPAEAAALSSRYVDGAEWQRSRPGLTPETRQSLFREFVVNYRFFAGLKGLAGDSEGSFQLSELSKARTLLESMTGRHAAYQSGLPTAERERLLALDAQLQASAEQLARTAEPDVRQRLETRRSELARQYDGLRTTLRRQYPKFDQLSEVRLIGADELRQLVPPQTAVISYLVHGGRDFTQVLAHVVGSDGRLQYRNLGLVPHLSELVDTVRLAAAHPGGLARMLAEEGRTLWRLPGDAGYRLLERQAPAPQGAVAVGDTTELPRYLASRLLAPLAPVLGGASSWVISPDGPLAQLPFELLPHGPRGEPAIAGVDIHYTQSLSVLALTRAKQRELQSLGPRLPLFAMGNAQYQPGDAEPRPARSRARQLRTDAATPLSALNGQWPNLPGTQHEVEAVAALWGDAARTYLGAQATEQMLQTLNAKGELARYRYLLFSAHGFLSPTDASLSSLVLGLVSPAPGTDGYVTAAEWPAYELRSDLTVLSACDTGIGPLVSGEGVMGLPFALFVAGSVNTALSLWPVDDGATAAFMAALFGRLKSGLTPSQALAATKREFLQHPRSAYRSPAVWAPFILVGAG